MKIRELLSAPSRWIKRDLARDVDGNQVHPIAAESVCWCLIGAVVRCYRESEQVAIIKKIQAGVGMFGSDWQDAPERTFEEVRQLVEELDI